MLLFQYDDRLYNIYPQKEMEITAALIYIVLFSFYFLYYYTYISKKSMVQFEYMNAYAVVLLLLYQEHLLSLYN